MSFVFSVYWVVSLVVVIFMAGYHLYGIIKIEDSIRKGKNMPKINIRDIIASSDGRKATREIDRRNIMKLVAARMVKEKRVFQEKRSHKQYA